MKIVILLNIALLLFMSSIIAQDASHKQLIENFLDSIEKKDMSVQDLHDQGIIYLSSDNRKKIKDFNIEYAQPVFQSIRNQLKMCNNAQDQSFTIFSLNQAMEDNSYNLNIQIPEKGDVYILYCNDDIVTHFLIANDKIKAFSTINKGGQKVFITL